MDANIITYDAAPRLSWPDAVQALWNGHRRPRADVRDMVLGSDDETLLSRAAFVPGLGYGVKSVTVFGGNPERGLPSVQGAMLVFGSETGGLDAIVDSRLVTEFKTAADSVLGARLLARSDARTHLIVGAGTVARSLVAAYGAAFPGLERVLVWARRPEQAQALADACTGGGVPVEAVTDLAAAAGEADIISTATMAREPVLRGDWIRPGTHVDLIGAFTGGMREADDALISGGSLFVDSRETTIGHIGELTIPIEAGVIGPDAVRADFYDLIADGADGRRSDDDITVFKNGGGAHMDLMIADYIATA